MRNSDLSGADLEDAYMNTTNLRGADLHNARLAGVTDLTNADLNGADVSGADFNNVVLDQADLRNTDLSGIANWKSIQSIKFANILGCKNAPDGFVAWAVANGAVQLASDAEWGNQIRAATRPSGSAQ